MLIKASDNSANVYLLSFLIVVGLGTLLIGYDASVIFGAEKGLLMMFNSYRIIGGVGGGIIPLAVIVGVVLTGVVNSYILSNHIQPLVEEMGRGIAALHPAAQWTVTIGWRYMFGAEAIPAELFIMLVCFFPEKIIR